MFSPASNLMHLPCHTYPISAPAIKLSIFPEISTILLTWGSFSACLTMAGNSDISCADSVFICKRRSQRKLLKNFMLLIYYKQLLTVTLLMASLADTEGTWDDQTEPPLLFKEETICRHRATLKTDGKTMFDILHTR